MSLDQRQEQNLFETGIVQSLVTKDDIVLDIGANIGYFTILLARFAKHVYAFEPEPNNFKQLQENTKHLDNVDNIDIAISNRLDYTTLYLCPTDNGMHRLYKSKWCEGGEQIKNIPTTTIDRFIYINLDNDKKKKDIKFIKIDVEGYEYKVLQGMTDLLKFYH